VNACDSGYTFLSLRTPTQELGSDKRRHWSNQKIVVQHCLSRKVLCLLRGDIAFKVYQLNAQTIRLGVLDESWNPMEPRVFGNQSTGASVVPGGSSAVSNAMAAA
jgi:hypothetical protein